MNLTSKTVFDRTFALFALVCFSPLFILVGLLIKIIDGGPVLFKQERIGKNCVPFTLYKFKSMRMMQQSHEGHFAPGDQSRITKLGKLLRSTKLDELPQLINVLRGNMSMVGPRPEVEHWIAAYPERWRKVLSVNPGITDNASIAFRHEEELLVRSKNPERVYRELVLPAKLLLYEDYVDHHSFAGDLKLLLKTIFYVIFK